MRSQVLIVFVFCIIGQVDSSDVRVSRCDVCDDDTPGQECSNSTVDTGTNCFGETPYCGTRISLAGSIHKVWKGCVSEQTCIDEWWLRTRLEPACSRSSVTSGHTVSGVTCSFCCHEQSFNSLYCNHELYPESLSQFPNIVASTTPTPTTTHAPTSPTTVQTTQPNPVTCPVCVTDSTTGLQCDEAKSLDLCDQHAPYCMTSFYRQPHGYRVEKRCADFDECTALWLNDSKHRHDCTQHGLTAGSGADLECHYCCQNPLNGNLCNSNGHGQHIKPNHLMHNGYHNHDTTTQTTTTTTATSTASSSTQSPGMHAMNCIQCVTDTTTQEQCDEDNQLQVCKDDHFYCMTSFYRTPNSYRIEKSCATRAQCELMWWQNTFNKTACRDRDLSPGTGSDLECHFCCFSTDIDVTFCNDDHDKVVPKNLILMGQDTPATTTAAQTTASQPQTPSTTPASQGHKCQVCLQDPSSLQYCLDTDVHSCGDDEPYCLNTITYSGQQISVSKSCASRSVCEWQWHSTKSKPECLLTHPSPVPGQADLICSYCCNSSDPTGTPCNVFDMPENLVQFPTTTTATTTTSTTPSTSTATTPTTPTTTTTATTTTATSAATSSSCAVCDDLCVFFQKEQPCSTGYCMTSVTDDAFFSRIVTKSCVTEQECYKRWWQESSDRNICYSFLDNKGPSGVATQCNYCCVGDNCNSPDFPAQSTLYDGNGKTP